MTVKASNRETKRNVASDSERKGANLSCKACGHAFVTFLEEMAEHNAKQMVELEPRKAREGLAEVTCPKCGKTHDYS